ncbi:MAG: cysteine synthase A [Clostridia bacterium]|nr:cysteine synthase A [Clostridia bacterium]
MIFSNITELIGKTPLLCASRYAEKTGAGCDILLKLECFNPAGSIKDRVAFNMLKNALNSGIINKGAVIIEPTSGNTGIGLAMAGAYYGMRVILTMPDTMSIERRKILSAYGAEIVLTPGSEGMKGAIAKAEEIRDNTPNSFIPSQFDNPANPEAHYLTTAPEIWKDTEGNFDILVATFGTGGTVSGIGRWLKEKKGEIEIVAVEPADSPLVTKGVAGPHKIQGIGANFIPDNLDRTVIDKVMTAEAEESFEAMRKLARYEGCFVGISSGAALSVALTLSKLPENKGKKIVVICPDTGTRYLSEM